MKIVREYSFWLWLMRFCYRRIKIAQTKIPVGIPAMRDPDNICEGYTPRKRIKGDWNAECETDGHYLCRECIFNVNYKKA